MTGKIEPAPLTQPIRDEQPSRGLLFYLRGSWLFFKKMWPALYDLTTPEVYIFASAIAFNALLSFFSFFVLIGSILINVARWQHGYETAYRLMMALIPAESSSPSALLFRSLDQVTRGPLGQASLISVAILIFSSSGAFLPLEIALNRAWGFKEPRGMIRQQLTYLPLVVVCGAIFLCCVALASLWDYALGVLFSESIARQFAFKFVGTFVSLPFIVLTFFLIYYWLPNGKVKASQVFFTAVATAVLWILATFVYQLLLPILNFRGSYGQLFSIMIVVIWVFISSFILILGANLSAHQVLPQAWTGRLPLRLRPSRNEAQ